MTAKPSYEEFDKQVRHFEKIKLERNQGEGIIQEGEYRWLVENANELILVAQDGLIRFVNQKVFDYLGYSPEELKDRPFIKYIYPEDRKKVSERHLKRLKGEDLPGVYPFRVVDRDGKIRWMEINAVRSEWNGKPATLNYINDVTERKRAEEELRRNEKDLRESQRIAHVGSWRLDVSTNQVIWTEELYNMYGFDPSLPPPPYTEHMKLFTPESWERLSTALARTRETGIPYTLELETVRKDGSNGWMWVRGEAEVDSAGKTVELWGAAQDITRRKQVEEDLRQTKAILQTAMDCSPAGIAIADAPDGQLRYVNDAGLLIRGGDRQRVVKGVGVEQYVASWKLLDLDGRPLRTDEVPLAQAIMFGETNSRDFIIRRKEGEDRIVTANAAPIKDETGKITAGIVVFLDITERRIAEEALREKTKFLQNIIDTTSDLVSVTDMEGNFKFIGPSHSILGYDPNSLVGRNVMELVHPDDYQEIATALADFLVNREDGRMVEYRYRRVDGDYLWLETVGKFILDDAGNLKEILFTSRDLTARKRAEGELKRIEWMLSMKQVLNIDAQTENHDQGYGDLTELNQDGVILKSIGHERLKSFANDYLELLGTSSAIYEVNGDYAFGIFASGWCRMMDSASRKLCSTPDNVEALNSGRWLCHESCWSDCAKKAIAKGAEVDIACNGGIRMYAVPIYAAENVIGVINFGYGDPPKDPEKLKMLADFYHLNYDDLLREATAYDSRPPYIIELAKKRLSSSAKLIGSMVETNQATEALRESEEKLQALFSAMTEMVVLHQLIFDDKGTPCNYRILDCNQAFCRITGIKKETAVGKTATQLYKTESPPYLDVYTKVALSGEPAEFFTEYAPMEKHFLVSVVSPRKNFFATITSDITEIKHAEVEREKLQTQLNQAQKMESVGRLAGGVAHDFNNMLGVILGHTELALLKADEDNDLISDLQEIQNAAKRSADITKQLLAFARKQTISPRQLDLNDTVESMLNMLRRLIGEDIDLVWKPSTHLWSVKMDPSQIDQILANLCVNARDAIDGVGKITIETGRKSFDEEYCKEHPGFIPGNFVLLAVSDNGCGMDKDTLDNLFEPFFTTKDVGKGTGLGLATIYGIVKQNKGFINVYSEPGQGATFKIYLPRVVENEEADKAVPQKKAAAGGTETILLVEDEPSILRMTRMMLEKKGYSVLSAATPAEAVENAKNHSGAIDLLMTDVVMPGMNGRDLAGQITDLYPDIRLLFMSGYTANVIAHQGILDDGVSFIQKPFSMADMTEKVRELLDMISDKNQG